MARTSKYFKFFHQDFLGDSKVMTLPNDMVGLLVKIWCHMAQSPVSGWLYESEDEPMSIARMKVVFGFYHASYLKQCLAKLVKSGLLFKDRRGAYGSPKWNSKQPYFAGPAQVREGRSTKDRPKIDGRLTEDHGQSSLNLSTSSSRQKQGNKGKSRKDGGRSPSEKGGYIDTLIDRKTPSPSPSEKEGRSSRGKPRSAASKPLPVRLPELDGTIPAVAEAVAVLKSCHTFVLKDIRILMVWHEQYPALNLAHEIKKCDAWAMAKGVNRSQKGWQITMHNWLRRSSQGGFNGRRKEAGSAKPEPGKSYFPDRKF